MDNTKVKDNLIKKHRIAQGLTQGELSYKAKVSLASISKAENGHQLSERIQQKIASALNIPIKTLFQE